MRLYSPFIELPICSNKKTLFLFDMHFINNYSKQHKINNQEACKFINFLGGQYQISNKSVFQQRPSD